MDTAGPSYLRRRNFPVVLPASRTLPRGGNAAASASVGDRARPAVSVTPLCRFHWSRETSGRSGLTFRESLIASTWRGGLLRWCPVWPEEIAFLFSLSEQRSFPHFADSPVSYGRPCEEPEARSLPFSSLCSLRSSSAVLEPRT